jgi:hypothetical protein
VRGTNGVGRSADIPHVPPLRPCNGTSNGRAHGIPARIVRKLNSGVGERNRLTGEARAADQPTYSSGKAIRGVPASRRM